MIKSTIRDSTPEERGSIKRRSGSRFKSIETFVINMVFVYAILLAPLLIYDHFIPVSSYIQGVSSIILVVIAFITAYLINHKYNRYKGFNNRDISKVQVVEVNCSRAIRREDPDDFGAAFYIGITDKGKQKTLFLWGQYLDEIDDMFPNTEFEFTRLPGSDEFIDFKTTGIYFKEERVLPPFNDKQLKQGKFPVNGQLLNKSIDTIQ